VCISVCLTSLAPCTLHLVGGGGWGAFLHPQWGRAMPWWQGPLWSSIFARLDVAAWADISVSLSARSFTVPLLIWWARSLNIDPVSGYSEGVGDVTDYFCGHFPWLEFK
jgi:hypothetical protein